MLKRIVRTIYPATCILCGRPGQGDRDLCRACEADIQTNGHACRACAIPLPEGAHQQLCGQCLQQPPLFDSAWSPFLYVQPLEWIIQQIKFNSRFASTRVLADLLAQQVSGFSRRPDCIIAVPLHPRRMRERGFNQSLEMIKLVAKQHSIPVDNKNCWREKYARPQTGMNAKQRRQNIKGAFKFNNVNQCQHVLLFDDVITTGSTVTELTGVLKRQGVKRVDVWSLARAEKHYR